MSLYRGRFIGLYRGGKVVTVDGKPLPPVKPSEDDYFWGYQGSGPYYLAKAILAHEFAGEMDQEAIIRFSGGFGERVTTKIPMGKPWMLTSADIRQVYAEVLADCYDIILEEYECAKETMPQGHQFIIRKEAMLQWYDQIIANHLARSVS